MKRKWNWHGNKKDMRWNWKENEIVMEWNE